MVPKLLNKERKAKPKSNDKATLHGEVDPLDRQTENSGKNTKNLG